MTAAAKPFCAFLRRAGWPTIFIVAVWAIDLVLLPFAPFRVAWLSFYPVAAWLLLMAAIAAVYTVWRPSRPIVAAAVATSQLLLFTLGAAVLNYLGFMAHRPLFDRALTRMDHSLGFHWLRFVHGLARIPHANDVLLIAYGSSMIQVTVIVVFLALSGRFLRLEQFMLGFMLSGLITIGIWIAFPNFGAYIFYYSVLAHVPTSGIAIDSAYAKAVIDMYSGIFPPFRYDNILGLVGFPSFHTALAALCVWAVRDVKMLGIAAIVANTFVVLSVPAQGGHHLIDLFGGIAVIAIAVWLAERLTGARRASVAVIEQSARA